MKRFDYEATKARLLKRMRINEDWANISEDSTISSILPASVINAISLADFIVTGIRLHSYSFNNSLEYIFCAYCSVNFN